MPPSLASGLWKLKSDGTGQCLYLARYCSQTPREICLFRITSLGWSQILAKINEGDVCILLLSIFVARESQCLQWSHFAKSQGQAGNFEVQLTTTTTTTTTQQQHNCAFYAASTCTWELCSGGGDPGHSVGPREAVERCALTCVIHPYLLVPFTYNELYSNCIASKTVASQKLGNQCKGFSPLLPDGDCTASRLPHLSGSVAAHSGLQGLTIVLTSLHLSSSPLRRVRLFLHGPVVPHVG